jgi:hypothetical protein
MVDSGTELEVFPQIKEPVVELLCHHGLEPSTTAIDTYDRASTSYRIICGK